MGQRLPEATKTGRSNGNFSLGSFMGKDRVPALDVLGVWPPELWKDSLSTCWFICFCLSVHTYVYVYVYVRVSAMCGWVPHRPEDVGFVRAGAAGDCELLHVSVGTCTQVPWKNNQAISTASNKE